MENVILALPAECWRWIPGYEGLYQVSTRGRVRSVDRWVTCKEGSKTGSKRFRKGKILKPQRDKGGYLQVCLSRDGKKLQVLVHRLVAETWIDNPENKPQVNHRDEDKTNNDVYNIEFMTAKENVNWGTGRERQASSMLNGSLSKPVEAVDPNTGVVVMEFPSVSEAGRKGFEYKNISACCLGKHKTHKGYKWRFKER